ncbi:MAG: GxxExxY protein [Lacibacter sp.]|nr:GxxExxY protein [Lacibacter sp.]
MAEILYKADVYKIIGVCLEVYNTLGYGFQEIVYKDAMEVEFSARSIPFIREDKILVNYKEITLRHSFITDFILFEQILVEVKVNKDGIADIAIAQTLNYLKASGLKLGLIINFGGTSLEYKRLIY